MRPVTPGTFGVATQKRIWIRENRALVDGQPLTPFVRVATAADFTNPLANSGSEGLKFINADITLYLHRLPDSDWIGFETTDHGNAEGVAVGACRLYDTGGPIGHSLVCAVANERRRS
jgi:acyl-CoA thioesterase